MTEPNERKDAVKPIKRHARGAAIVLAVTSCALTASAWGPSSQPTSASRHGSILAFKHCMRAHGVPMDAGPGATPSSRSLEAARAACDRLLPGFAHAKAQMLEISKCMRRHAISRFPDPSVSLPPNSNPARAVAHSGVILAIPSSVSLRTSAFKRAATVCGFPPDDWYPLHGGGPFAGAEHGQPS